MSEERFIGLALSGGGYRASLFHLGAMRRLNELGLLNQVATISSVSGGSILSGYVADKMLELDKNTPQFDDWEKDVGAGFRRFVGKDIRTGLFLRFAVVNAFAPKFRANALADAFWHRLTKRYLGALPTSGEGTEFLFLATDIERAISWRFGPRVMNSYKMSEEPSSEEISIARAVAASACFPPIFGPIRLETKQGFVAWLSDGGVYDNSGMEPIWKGKKHQTILVSDGGTLLAQIVPKTYGGRLMRYNSIAMDQVRALRQNRLIAKLQREKRNPKGKRGTLWRNASKRSSFRKDADQDAKQQIEDLISAGWYGYDDSDGGTIDTYLAQIRTDLDRFTTAEAKILENHGYFCADIALRTHVSHLIDPNIPFQVPHDEEQYTDDDQVKKHLKNSASRMRFIHRRFVE